MFSRLHPSARSALRQIRRRINAFQARYHAAGLETGERANPARNRVFVAHRYLQGSGIEVGALHNPLPVPRAAVVRYVDRMSTADLRRQYPELAHEPLTEPHVIDDGEKLGSFADASVDFVIANHFIEHCEDPIGTLIQFMRVIRPGGVIYLAVPDKRHSFDHSRPLTTVEHLLADHTQGPQQSRRTHFVEFAGAMKNLIGDPEYAKVIQLLVDPDFLQSTSYSIHYHVWDHNAFLAFLSQIRDPFGIPYDIEFALRNGSETIAILRRL
jgi:SAM-dependent methyltransferase